MMPIALQHGIGVDEFERRTFKEIDLIIEARLEVRNNELKSGLMQSYQMVDLMAASIGRIMSEDVEFPEIYQLYPTMFEDEQVKLVEEQKKRLEEAKLAAEWKAFAVKANSSIREKKSKTEVEK